MSTRRLVLVTGATGYVGGRLLPALLARGEHVRCLARRPEAIAPRTDLEVVAGDALDAAAVRRALEGVGVAYYLIHAMGTAEGFEERDRQAATLFAEAARDAGVQRLVYLGGLGSGPDLSTHLASRQEVGRLLASTGVETIEFRASIVIGSGSLPFELVRSLTERLPVMITPRWVRTRAQPIAIEGRASGSGSSPRSTPASAARSWRACRTRPSSTTRARSSGSRSAPAATARRSRGRC